MFVVCYVVVKSHHMSVRNEVGYYPVSYAERQSKYGPPLGFCGNDTKKIGAMRGGMTPIFKSYIVD